MTRIDLTEQRFGRLLVIECVGSNKNGRLWKCKCDCGKEKIISQSDLIQNKTISCGCYRREKAIRRGLSHHRLYPVWQNIVSRCYKESQKCYKYYGGRGIKVCDEWKDNFVAFYNWAIANGYDEKAEYGKCTIDRIDVNGDYEPQNCRWLTVKEQANNRRSNRLITINGETKTLQQWSDLYCIEHKTIAGRYKRGKRGEDLIAPPKTKNRSAK